ncbi:unnamed protein product [Timema podura]|uniref:Uncharacterized protein n=1 Tax=Timema podura TaxID=61482 RepID=A0ABN7P7Y6_TIMPD|nr:unnamed protein product [Timema podura]
MLQRERRVSVCLAGRLTEDYEQADQYCREGSHAKLEGLPLLNQLTVLPPETPGTHAAVPVSGVLVDAGTAVETGDVQTLVLVCAAFVVWGHDLALTAAVYRGGLLHTTVTSHNTPTTGGTQTRANNTQQTNTSTHSKGSGQITLAHGLLEGQFLSRLRAMVAWPHWVPFMAGGKGRCFPSSLMSSRQPDRDKFCL